MSGAPRDVGKVGTSAASGGGRTQKAAPIGSLQPKMSTAAQAKSEGKSEPLTGLNQPLVPFIPPPEWQARETGWAVDRVLPAFDVQDGCRIAIAGPPEEILPTLVSLELRRSWAERLLFALRVSPEFAGRNDHRPTGHTIADLRSLGLVPLLERPGEELAFGLAGRPWLSTPDIRKLDAKGFERFADRRAARLAWSFRLDRDGAGPGIHWLASELRVECLSQDVRWVFGGYWSMIRPFANQVLRQMLQAVKRIAEGSGPAEDTLASLHPPR